MKLKFGNYLVSSTVLVLLNIMYFIWQPYSKQIIGLTNVSDIITSIIYFFTYFVVLIFLVNCCFVEKDNKPSLKKSSILIGTMFIAQLISDFIKIILLYIAPNSKFIINDIFAVLCFSFNIVLLIKAFGAKQSERKKHKTLFFVLWIICFIILIVCEIKNYHDISFVNYISFKYDTNSIILETLIKNYKFEHEIKSLLVETLCVLIVFIGVYIRYSVTTKKTDQDSRLSNSIVRTVSRIMLILIAFVVLTVLKVSFLPMSSIGNIRTSSSSVNSSIRDYKLKTSGSTTEIDRRLGPSKSECIYQTRETYFQMNNLVLHSMREELLPYDIPSEFYLKEYEYNGTKFSTYGNKLLIIHKDKNYQFINLEDISKLEYDKDIINGLSYMISHGAYTYFEYGYNYLQKHEPDFIEIYSDTYKNGNFYHDDNPYNFEINENFIKNLAKSKV